MKRNLFWPLIPEVQSWLKLQLCARTKPVFWASTYMAHHVKSIPSCWPIISQARSRERCGENKRLGSHNSSWKPQGCKDLPLDFIILKAHSTSHYHHFRDQAFMYRPWGTSIQTRAVLNSKYDYGPRWHGIWRNQTVHEALIPVCLTVSPLSPWTHLMDISLIPKCIAEMNIRCS